MPALLALYIFNKDRRDFVKTTSKVVFDVALLTIGVGEVQAAYKAYQATRTAYATYIGIKALVDVGMSISDIVINDALAKQWSTTPEGQKRLERWNTINMYYGIGTITAFGIEAAVKKFGTRTINTAEEFDNFADELDNVQGAGSLVNSLKKLVGKASSENILWKNLDEVNIIWSNPNSNVLSTAKSFANETGTSLYDAVLSNGFYAKFDLNDGRILLGNTNGNYHAFAVLNDAELGAFKSSVLNVSDEVFNTKLSQLLSTNADKLKVLSGVLHKQLNIAGKTVMLSPNKVNTILGRYDPEMRNLFSELGSFKNVGLGEAKGGINILNKPNFYYDKVTWWNAYNKPWLDKAIARGDDIYVATNIKVDKLFDASKNEITSFGYEMKLLKDKGYKPINISTSEWEDAKLIINQVFK